MKWNDEAECQQWQCTWWWLCVCVCVCVCWSTSCCLLLNTSFLFVCGLLIFVYSTVQCLIPCLAYLSASPTPSPSSKDKSSNDKERKSKHENASVLVSYEGMNTREKKQTYPKMFFLPRPDLFPLGNDTFFLSVFPDCCKPECWKSVNHSFLPPASQFWCA